jgi:ABC-type phosphate/phosphonate transport system substrate-binding protein
MSLPWGVRKDLDESVQEAYKTYLKSMVDKTLEIEDGIQAQILKADVKERKGNYMMILRYQLNGYQGKTL